MQPLPAAPLEAEMLHGIGEVELATVNAEFGNLQAEYQRRNDLIGNLVEVTKASAQFEQQTGATIDQLVAVVVALALKVERRGAPSVSGFMPSPHVASRKPAICESFQITADIAKDYGIIDTVLEYRKLSRLLTATGAAGAPRGLRHMQAQGLGLGHHSSPRAGGAPSWARRMTATCGHRIRHAARGWRATRKV